MLDKFEPCSGAFNCVFQDSIELLEFLRWHSLVYLALFWLAAFLLTSWFRTSKSMEELKESAQWGALYTALACFLFLGVMLFVSPSIRFSALKQQYELEVSKKNELVSQLANKTAYIESLESRLGGAEDQAKQESQDAMAVIAQLQRDLKGKENVIDELRSRLDDKTNKQLVCDTLGNFIEEGTALLKRSRNEKEPPPVREAESWASRAESYLQSKLQKSYVARFRSAAGLRMPPFTSIQSDEHLNLWTGVYVRIARLEEFSKAHCP